MMMNAVFQFTQTKVSEPLKEAEFPSILRAKRSPGGAEFLGKICQRGQSLLGFSEVQEFIGQVPMNLYVRWRALAARHLLLQPVQFDRIGKRTLLAGATSPIGKPLGHVPGSLGRAGLRVGGRRVNGKRKQQSGGDAKPPKRCESRSS